MKFSHQTLFILLLVAAALNFSHGRLMAGENQPVLLEDAAAHHDTMSVNDAQKDPAQQERELAVVSKTLPHLQVHDEQGDCRVVVSFKDDSSSAGGGSDRQRRRLAKSVDAKWTKDLSNIGISSMMLPCENVETLRKDDSVDWLEEDAVVTPDSENVPLGITMARGTGRPAPVSSASSACSDPNSFKVAIIDSGLEVNHPDVPCGDIYSANANCKGISMGVPEPWYAPMNNAWHGTHIFGTIGATGGNDQGVAGMVPDSSGICYLVVRIFGDESKEQFASVVYEGIDWAISEKANVINMSFGSPDQMAAGQRSVSAAYASGALVVASAGNNGSRDLNYPAAYNGAIGVAAVESNKQRASFSQVNAMVDIAAPGVSVLSTYLRGRYSLSTGTSMAVPHVTGAIASAWSACRECSNAQVETCLLNTASRSARNDELGFGIVSATATYDCLVNTDGCCAGEAAVRQSDPEVDEPDPEPVQDEPEPPQPITVQNEKQVIEKSATTSVTNSPATASSGSSSSSSSSGSGSGSGSSSSSSSSSSQCSRRRLGQRCRRSSQCCSGSCVGSWRKTCR